MAFLKLLRHNADRVLATVLSILGLVALTLGWAGTSNHVYPAAQIPYVVSGGLLGLFLLGMGGTLWLSADLRDEWRKLDQLLEAIQQATAQSPQASGGAPPPASNGNSEADTTVMTPAPPADREDSQVDASSEG